jgi:hypothetical protein
MLSSKKFERDVTDYKCDNLTVVWKVMKIFNRLTFFYHKRPEYNSPEPRLFPHHLPRFPPSLYHHYYYQEPVRMTEPNDEVHTEVELSICAGVRAPKFKNIFHCLRFLWLWVICFCPRPAGCVSILNVLHGFTSGHSCVHLPNCYGRMKM